MTSELGIARQAVVVSDAALGALDIEPSGALLARPDGFVAWRARNGGQASIEGLRAALDAITARNPRQRP
jgi:hypothetical protein